MTLHSEKFDTGNAQVDSALTLFAEYQDLASVWKGASHSLSANASNMDPSNWAAKIERASDDAQLASVRYLHRQRSIDFIRAFLVERSLCLRMADLGQKLSEHLKELLKLYHQLPMSIPHVQVPLIQSAIVQIHDELQILHGTPIWSAHTEMQPLLQQSEIALRSDYDTLVKQVNTNGFWSYSTEAVEGRGLEPVEFPEDNVQYPKNALLGKLLSQLEKTTAALKAKLERFAYQERTELCEREYAANLVGDLYRDVRKLDTEAQKRQEGKRLKYELDRSRLLAKVQACNELFQQTVAAMKEALTEAKQHIGERKDSYRYGESDIKLRVMLNLIAADQMLRITGRYLCEHWALKAPYLTEWMRPSLLERRFGEIEQRYSHLRPEGYRAVPPGYGYRYPYFGIRTDR